MVKLSAWPYVEKTVQLPIHHAENLRCSLFSTTVTARGLLNSEGSRRAIMSFDGQASPTIAMRSTVLDIRTEPPDATEVLVVVFVLDPIQTMMQFARGKVLISHLSVLSRYLYFIEFGVLELDEIVTQIVQRLHPRASV